MGRLLSKPARTSDTEQEYGTRLSSQKTPSKTPSSTAGKPPKNYMARIETFEASPEAPVPTPDLSRGARTPIPATASLQASSAAAGAQPQKVDPKKGIPKPPPPTLWELALKTLPGGSQNQLIKMPGKNLANNIIGDVEQKLKECNDRRWFYNRDGEKIFFVESLVVQLKRYAGIGDVLIQHDPNVVALVWGGLRGLLQIGSSYVDTMRSVTESIEYLLKLLYCCDFYERVYCKMTDLQVLPELKGSLLKLYECILKYLLACSKYLEKNTSGRVLKSFSESLERLLNDIKGNEKDVTKMVDTAEKEAAEKGRSDHKTGIESLKVSLKQLRDPIPAIERVAQKIYATVEVERRNKILAWLSAVKYLDHHNLSSGRRQADTGLWLCKNSEFNKWRESEESSLLWIRGDAGVGKTILASFIVDEFRGAAISDDHALAYFYCHYKEPDRRDPGSILRAIVKQLCFKRVGQRQLPELLSQIYKDREDDGHSRGPLSPEECKDLIISLSGHYQTTTIVVDALDECDRVTRRELFCVLNELSKSAAYTKILVTSRYDQDINEFFSRELNHYIVANDNTADINLYINAEIGRRCDKSQAAGKHKLLLDGDVDPVLKSSIISTLQEKANGMFMWVNLQIVALCEEETPAGVRDALTRLPRDLEEAYLRILHGATGSQSPNSNRVARIILQWLLYAQEACTTASVIQALTIEIGKTGLNEDGLKWTTKKILGLCKNLVVHDGDLDIFRFAHFSVQEFLLRQSGFEAESSNKHITGVCLTTLLYHHSNGSLPELYTYSTKYWAAHAQVLISGTTSEALPRSLCLDFLKNPEAYEKWGLRILRRYPDFAGKRTRVASPLWISCHYQLCDLAIILLDRLGDDINSQNKSGRSPLSWAAENGREEVVQLLLERKNVEVNSKDTEYNRTPLSWAAESGHEKVVRLLLGKKDVDVDSRDEVCGRSPLSWAAQKGHEKVVQLLLERKVLNVNSKDTEHKRSPLSWAAGNGHDKVVKLLLGEEDVEVDIGDAVCGRRPLSWAAENGRGRVVELLLGREDVDVNSKDPEYGRSAISWAAENGHDRVVELLLEREDLDVNSKDTIYGQNALCWAAKSGSDNVVKVLLERGDVIVNCKDMVYGQDALCWAAMNGHDKVVKLLLGRKDVDVNSKDTRYGWSPLAWATSGGHDKVVKYLQARLETVPGVDN